MKKILIVGGAGYIGSHMNLALKAEGYEPWILDDFSTGHREALCGSTLIQGSLGDRILLSQLFLKEKFDAVMHFGAFIQVGESVKDPSRYYQNNLANTLNLLDAMREFNLKRFIFSSTAAVFGEPQYLPIDENHPKHPVNPYGWSKFMVEQILADYDKAYGLKSVIFRYFNAAGADPEARVGECHEPETHLIPLILEAMLGKRESISVFGRDYETPDGTCIRDYIHVSDLCVAHMLGLKHLLSGGESRAYNLGNGQGFSVQEVIDVAKKVSHRSVKIVEAARREGDPARLIADSCLIKKEWGWEPRYASLELMVRHAWGWAEKQ